MNLSRLWADITDIDEEFNAEIGITFRKHVRKGFEVRQQALVQRVA